jgi:hypothetical protein
MLCYAPFAQAAVFWDDEMEGTTSGEFYFQTYYDQGTYLIDTSVKFSGTASKRVRFFRPGGAVETCDVTQAEFNAGQQCGGEVGRSFTASADVYTRSYFMMSGSSTPLTAPAANCLTGAPTDALGNCLFKSSTLSSTKMQKRQSAVNSAFTEQNIRGWWQIGKTGGTNFMMSTEHVPTYNSTTDVPFANIQLQSNRWYCIETHEKVNTGGLANGIAQAWVDGVEVLNRTTVTWQRAPSSATPGNYLWNQLALMRQNGLGYFWWDRVAAGDARIGCLGTPSPTDITNPNPPTNFQAQ